LKLVSIDLQAHLAQETTTLCRLWKITRQDDVVIAVTDHDEDITFDSVLYSAADGFTASAVEHKSDASPDNLEVIGFLDSEFINENDIRAHLYDDADVELRVVNWSDLSQGELKLLLGKVGDIKMINGIFQVELRGLTQKLTTVIGSTYGPICRAELFGGGAENIDPSNHWKCRLNRADWVQNGTVHSSADPTTVVPDSGLLMIGSATPATAAPEGWFNDGVIIFTSGVLNGYKFEISSWDGSKLNLFAGSPMPFQPAVGDTFEIEPGCDKRRETCQSKFNNIVNFAGESDIPGLSVMMQTPVAHTS
jgi:uncharacterized phage protein (TIGR02218 family)